MDIIIFLIPLALFLGICALGGFYWSLKSGQFDDLTGAGMRVLLEDAQPPDKPSPSSDV